MNDCRQAILARVMKRVVIDHETGCWIWQGATSGNGRGGGYPRMCLDGQTLAVHRVTFVCTYGYVRGKKTLDHTCRARLCVNPDHLEMVTNRGNCRRRDHALAEVGLRDCDQREAAE
ncbi:HNH endonuclease [Breoghania sp.]|uniref:HNH endonuclease n=1 Tax=Breoghania sp. TaxID=2065378 RepID=UPI0029C9CFDD|nr:HNH endonuclease [Breoghania sp.]